MENNYVFKDSAPNTIENAYFDNPQPKIPFRMRIKERMHTTKPMILMGAANLLILLFGWLANFLGNMLFQKFYEQGGNSFLMNYSYTAVTNCIINIATVAVLVVLGFVAYKKFIGMLKFAGCYTAAVLVGELFFSIGQAITFAVFAVIDNGDMYVHSYYGMVCNILSIIGVVISIGLSILFTRLLIRKG